LSGSCRTIAPANSLKVSNRNFRVCLLVPNFTFEKLEGFVFMRRCWLCLLIFISLSVLFGEGGRDFAGQWAVGGVTQSNGSVSATLMVQLTNFSGRDVAGARIVLRTAKGDVVLAESAVLAYRARKGIHVNVTISSEEFAVWQRRGPIVAIEAKGNGNPLQGSVAELVRVPVVAEEN